jgi:HEAT repeat protein
MTQAAASAASIDALIKELGGDKDQRARAVEALRAIGEPAIPALATAAYGPLEGTACGAAEALAAIGGKQAESALATGLQGLAQALLQASMPFMMQGGLEKSNARVPDRMGAFARALGQLKAAEAVGALLAALEITRHLDQRPNAFGETTVWILRALGEIGDPKAVGKLIDLLWDKFYGGESVRALGKIGDARAVTPLVNRISGGHGSHGTAIGVALKDIGAFEVVDDLIAQVAKEGPGPRTVDTLAALKAMTGQDFGLDTTAWTTWWKAENVKRTKAAAAGRKSAR